MINKILRDIRIELLDEFDKNFSRGGFFSKPWPKRRDGSSTHLNNTGRLRRSITARISGHSVIFTSSEPYAAIHNYGGTITVTPKMKKFFWAKFKETGQERYKHLALMKTGAKIRIPQRQFIGHSPEVTKAVEDIVRSTMDAEMKKVASQKP